jgi:alkyl hydroperoxide reductase subunit AhpC
LRQFYWELRGLGVDLVAAANDTPETNKELRARLDLPFMLLSDEDAQVARAYGAFHEDEPRGRSIARYAVFLIADVAGGGRVLWEYVGPTNRHRVAFSRLSEEVQAAQGRARHVVSVVVPSAWQVERGIAELQEPPLGLSRTPPQDALHRPGVLTERDYLRELAMQSHAEVLRLTAQGWTLVAVVPEVEGTVAVGQRYVFQRDRP